VRRALRNNGLSIVAFGLFALAIVGQAVAGFGVASNDAREHGEQAPSFGAYLTSGHFLEALSENMESEFLQMAVFVLLTAYLFQRGSAESNDPNAKERALDRRTGPGSPWPARAGGLVSKVYAHSLSIALLVLFAGFFVLHAITGHAVWRAEQVRHGLRPGGIVDYATDAQFWFESFQNWQSEFFSVGVLVVLTIFLRERGSEQSKAVGAPHSQTGPE
jgi:hypothetical protein